MRSYHLLSASLILLGLIGCAAEPPADIEHEERAVSSIVALLAGYDSGGLRSLLSDLVEDSLAPESDVPLVVPASGRDGSVPRDRLLVRSRNGGAALGEVRLHYGVRPAVTQEHGAGETVTVEIDGEALHASPSLAIRATTAGAIDLAAAGPLRERSTSGELRIDGALGDRPGDGLPFTQVEATLSWKGLRLLCDRSGLSLEGEIAVSISASGAGGLVLRNGVLRFDASDAAVLDLGGRQYRIDSRRALVTK